MGKTFVIGDIHGAYPALRQCLERASFKYEEDKLIALGDVADGWPQTRQCINELLNIKSLTYVLGNHDFWTLEWMETGTTDSVWYDQGGKATVDSYRDGIPDEHISFLRKALPYYVEDERLFVHAGINPHYPVGHQTIQTFLWNRDLARTALAHYHSDINGKLTEYNEVYLGHTPVPYHHPIENGGVWLMDTGAGWSGVLSIMDVHTKEFWTSDPVPDLYPGIEGRKRK